MFIIDICTFCCPDFRLKCLVTVELLKKTKKKRVLFTGQIDTIVSKIGFVAYTYDAGH